MAIAMADHSKWATAQVSELITIGVNPVDAQASVNWVLRHLPLDADPATYVFPASALIDDLSNRESVADARIDWFANEDIAPKYKRLLDAKAI